MIDYARKNSDLFENTSLSFSLDYDLRIPLEDAPGTDADYETGRAIPEPVIEYPLRAVTHTAHVASPASAGVPNDVYKAAFTCYMLGIRWADIDLTAKTVTISGKVNRVPGGGMIRERLTKTTSGARNYG